MSRATYRQNTFSEALRTARNARRLSQEAFSLASSRTYVSSLERGLKSPTLKKVDELAEVLDIHPLTLLALSYINNKDQKAADALFGKVSSELSEIWRQFKL
jgi:transcriptional regulator with XRE-family HTH domain